MENTTHPEPTFVRINYKTAAERVRQLWTRDAGSWAETVDGRPTKIHAADAATFNKYGACIRAIEEQIGAGQATSPKIDRLDRMVEDRLRLRVKAGAEVLGTTYFESTDVDMSPAMAEHFARRVGAGEIVPR